MENNELDDLFRSNADYLGDEPPRGFDKEAFWQHLQAELPKKAERRQRLAAWWWAAASVLLAGMLGGIWWVQLGDLVVERKLANKVEVKTAPKQTLTPWSVSPHIRDAVGVGTSIRHRPRTLEKSHGLIPKGQKQSEKLLAKKEEVWSQPPIPSLDQVASETVEKLLLLEGGLDLTEVIAPTVPERPEYRVVHINEIRERKQQEAKARARLAFRLGVPVLAPAPEQSDDRFKISIPIPQ